MLPYGYWAPQSEAAHQAARRANEARSAAFYAAARLVVATSARLARSLVRSVTRARAWYRMRRAERHLASLDDRTLRDVGIRREDVAAAVRGHVGRRSGNPPRSAAVVALATRQPELAAPIATAVGRRVA